MPLLLGVAISAPESNNWTIRIEQRTRAAAARISGRKVILVGGSNLIFGVRAASLGQRIGLPVVNYGLHAGVGADVIAERASELIGPGDLVVLATEAMHSPGVEYRNSLRAEFLAHVARDRQLIRCFRWRQLYSIDLARTRCTLVRQAMHNALMSLAFREPGDPYALEAIGPDGSLLFARPTSRGLFVSPPPEDVSDRDLEYSVATRAFEILQQKCRQQHATLAVMPPCRLAAPGANLPLLLACERRWLALVAGRGALQLFGPGETLLDARFGYDSEYHLNDAGVAIMEPRLATALNALLTPEAVLNAH